MFNFISYKAWVKTVILCPFMKTHTCSQILKVRVSLSSVGKESACSAGDLGWIPGSGRSPGEGIGYPLQYSWTSLVAQLVKNPPAMRETWVWSLYGKILWRRKRLPSPVFWPGEFHGLHSPWGRRVWHNWVNFTFFFFFFFFNFFIIFF